MQNGKRLMLSLRREPAALKDAANHRPLCPLDSKSGAIPSFIHPRVIFALPTLLPHAPRPGTAPSARCAHAGRPATRTTATTGAESWESKAPLIAGEGEVNGGRRDAVSCAWPSRASVAWRLLLSQLGLSPQSTERSLQPQSPSPPQRPLSPSHPRRQIAPRPSCPSRLHRIPISRLVLPSSRPLAHDRSPVRLTLRRLVSTTGRHDPSRRRYRPASICAAVSVDT
jgi:hypothetical protein